MQQYDLIKREKQLFARTRCLHQSIQRGSRGSDTAGFSGWIRRLIDRRESSWREDGWRRGIFAMCQILEEHRERPKIELGGYAKQHTLFRKLNCVDRDDQDCSGASGRRGRIWSEEEEEVRVLFGIGIGRDRRTNSTPCLKKRMRIR